MAKSCIQKHLQLLLCRELTSAKCACQHSCAVQTSYSIHPTYSVPKTQPCKPGSLLPLLSLTHSSRDPGTGWSPDTLTHFVPWEGRLKYVKCKRGKQDGGVKQTRLISNKNSQLNYYFGYHCTSCISSIVYLYYFDTTVYPQYGNIIQLLRIIKNPFYFQ